MIESGNDRRPESDVELDLTDGLRLTGRVRWSQDGRIGLKFAEVFDLMRVGSLRTSNSGTVRPDYLGSELDPNSPWAARKERLTIKDVKRK